MINFFIKNKEVTLDCFTTDYDTSQLFPISPAKKFLPKWWKDLDKNPVRPNDFVDYIPSANMRGCGGFTEYFKRGFIIPLWSDLIIKTDLQQYTYQFSDEKTNIEYHPSETYNGAFSNYHHLKIASPWLLKCKEDIHFLFSSPFWNIGTLGDINDNFHIVPGVVPFKYVNSTNINMFVTKKENRYFLQAGTPLVYLYPNTDKKIKIKTHLMSWNDVQKMKKTNNFAFNFTYSKLLKLKKN